MKSMGFYDRFILPTVIELAMRRKDFAPSANALQVQHAGVFSK